MLNKSEIFMDALKKSGDIQKYVKVVNGELQFLDGTQPELPKEYRPLRGEPGDQIYRLLAYTCGGKCKVGEPIEKCFPTTDCAKYDPVLSYDNLEDMMEKHVFTFTSSELIEIINEEAQKEIFRLANCSMCGSQRCNGESEWLEGCKKWTKWKTTES